MPGRIVRVDNRCVLYRGDCTGPNAIDLARKLESKWGPIQLITADPPYGGILKAKWEMRAQQAYDFYMRLEDVAAQLLEPGASLVLFGGVGKPRARPFFRALVDIENRDRLLCAHLLTWGKRRAYGKANDYLFTREEIAWFVRGGTKPTIFNIPLLDVKRGYVGFNPKYPAKSEFKRRSSVWTDITEYFSGKVHEAQKPQALYEVLLATHSDKDGFVIDWCSGSGEAALAARKLGRRILLVEKDKKDFEKMVSRLFK